jgi:hypothetical protein
MTDKETAIFLEAKVREDGKRPPAEQIQELIRTGLIDEEGRVYTEQLRIVRELLHEKGFSDIDAFHRGHVAGGAIRLCGKHANGPNAEGPFTEICDIIGNVKNQNDLWESLAAAGYCQKPRESGMKKTG